MSLSNRNKPLSVRLSVVSFVKKVNEISVAFKVYQSTF